MKKRLFCFRCGHQVTRNRLFVSPGYFAACLWCDEDLYRCEVRDEV